jgi:hypothetical protein
MLFVLEGGEGQQESTKIEAQLYLSALGQHLSALRNSLSSINLYALLYRQALGPVPTALSVFLKSVENYFAKI